MQMSLLNRNTQEFVFKNTNTLQLNQTANGDLSTLWEML